MRTQFIAISGNIAVGKTTLCAVAEAEGHPVVRERVDDNVYCGKFYQNMVQWGFASQITFLMQKFLDIHGLSEDHGVVFIDRALDEDIEIFENNLWASGAISDRDHGVYRAFAEIARNAASTPDLHIVLNARPTTLMARILERGRPFEDRLTLGYVEALQARYDAWVAQLDPERLLRVDTEVEDLHDPAVCARILAAARDRLRAPAAS